MTIRGRIDKNQRGFAFLQFDTDEYEDLFIPPREAERFFQGDRVEVEMLPSGEVLQFRVIEHALKQLIGRYSQGHLVYERKHVREEVFVRDLASKPREDRPKEGDWIRVKLSFPERGPHRVVGEWQETYGQDLPATADIALVASELGLVEEHPEDAVREAAQAAKLDVQTELQDRSAKRRDLRTTPFITIDGETARDFDDAVYVERHGSGYVLWVAIADVSHYVREGMALDKDAAERGTSVYFPERAFHMLPGALSEGLCSLKPNEPRLAFTARMELDRHGHRSHVEIMESLIQSKRRATYTEIQREYEARGKNSKWEFAPHFELYQILRKMRSGRGSLDFDLPESEILVDPQGEPTEIRLRTRLDAHRLIEEFMICANEGVTEWMLERKRPFLYRIHEEPSEESLEKFSRLARTVGVRIDLRDTSRLAQSLSEFIRTVEDHPASPMLNMALLRSLKQAVYSAKHTIHFGLASEAYTHFTSPIRRYPDLVVHRLLRKALRGEGIPQGQESKLAQIADHSSYRERLAQDAERESRKIKQVRLMRPRLGEEFDGRITGMTERGFFVSIPDPYVEGMVPTDSLTDDDYVFNEERMILAGRRKKRTFRVGETVRVRAVRADLERRQIDFELVPA